VPALRGEARECASLALSRETPNPFESVGIAIDTVGGNSNGAPAIRDTVMGFRRRLLWVRSERRRDVMGTSAVFV
jgi:hypothetical protein